MPERVDADVCVVGAGYAGLHRRPAADRRRGKSVVVLEARDRIGGRIWTEPAAATARPSTVAVPGSDHGTTRSSGSRARSASPTYKTWVEGAHLLIDEGRHASLHRPHPQDQSRCAVITIALAQLKVDRMAKQVPLDAPWTAKHAAEWDSRSVAWWLETVRRSAPTVARDLFEMAVRGPLHRRPERDVVAPPAVPRSAPTGASTPCYRSEGGAPGEHGRGRRRHDRPAGCRRVGRRGAPRAPPSASITHRDDHVRRRRR